MIVVKRKITAKLAVIFLKMVDPKGIEPSNLTDANRALSQLSYGPILRFLWHFCNKLQLLQLFDFNGFQREITLKS